MTVILPIGWKTFNGGGENPLLCVDQNTAACLPVSPSAVVFTDFVYGNGGAFATGAFANQYATTTFKAPQGQVVMYSAQCLDNYGFYSELALTHVPCVSRFGLPRDDSLCHEEIPPEFCDLTTGREAATFADILARFWGWSATDGASLENHFVSYCGTYNIVALISRFHLVVSEGSPIAGPALGMPVSNTPDLFTGIAFVYNAVAGEFQIGLWDGASLRTIPFILGAAPNVGNEVSGFWYEIWAESADYDIVHGVQPPGGQQEAHIYGIVRAGPNDSDEILARVTLSESDIQAVIPTFNFLDWFATRPEAGFVCVGSKAMGSTNQYDVSLIETVNDSFVLQH